MTDNGHSCLKKPTSTGWIGDEEFDSDCPEKMIDMGDSCLKDAYVPKPKWKPPPSSNPIKPVKPVDPDYGHGGSQSGVLWKNKCGPQHYQIYDFCFSRCPGKLEKCGLICLDPEVVCSQDIIDVSMTGFQHHIYDSQNQSEYKDHVSSTPGNWCDLD